jgi:hypothetical protein
MLNKLKERIKPLEIPEQIPNKIKDEQGEGGEIMFKRKVRNATFLKPALKNV